MARLTTTERQILEKLFQMGDGYLLNFSDRTFGEFFRDDVGIDIFDPKYNYRSGSKANRMRGFWQAASDSQVGESVNQLLNYIDAHIAIGRLRNEDFPGALIARGHAIAARLTGSVDRGKSPLHESRLTDRQRLTRRGDQLRMRKRWHDCVLRYCPCTR